MTPVESPMSTMLCRADTAQSVLPIMYWNTATSVICSGSTSSWDTPFCSSTLALLRRAIRSSSSTNNA